MKTIITEKTQGNHFHRVLLTTLAGTHNISSRLSLAAPRVCKVPRQVRNSSFQFLSLFLQVISI
jgi:hypothetical protein